MCLHQGGSRWLLEGVADQSWCTSFFSPSAAADYDISQVSHHVRCWTLESNSCALHFYPWFSFVHPLGSSCSMTSTWLFQVMNYVDLRLKHRRIGSLLGLEKGAVDNFCSVWWLLGPQEMGCWSALASTKTRIFAERRQLHEWHWSCDNEHIISLLKRWKSSCCWHLHFGLVTQSLNLNCSCRCSETGRPSLFSFGSWEVSHILSFVWDVSRGYFPTTCWVSTVYPQLRSMKPQNDMVPISTLDARRGRCTQAGYWSQSACIGHGYGGFGRHYERSWFAKVWCCSSVVDMPVKLYAMPSGNRTILTLVSGPWGGSDQTAAWLCQEVPWLQLEFQMGSGLMAQLDSNSLLKFKVTGSQFFMVSGLPSSWNKQFVWETIKRKMGINQC